MRIALPKWFGPRSMTAFAVLALLVVAGCSSSTRPPAATQVTVSESSATANFGAAITFTATLSGGSAPSGVITFYDGATALQPVVISGGMASFTTSSLGPGQHSITAQYAGDAKDAASTSAATTVSIVVPTTTTLAASPTLAAAGDNVTLTATVTSANGTPTGSVSFFNGATNLGSATVNGSGVATFVTNALPLGTDSVTASYSATSYYLNSTSSAVTVQIHSALIATTTTLTVTPSTTVTAGTVVTLSATVSGTGGAQAPTGNITFFDGAIPLATAPINGSGAATFTTKSFAPGAHALTASYSGDIAYAPSTSAVTTLTVTAYTGATYSNPLPVTSPKGPVLNCPNPSIIKTQASGTDTWYAYCTGDALNQTDTTSSGFAVHLISVYSSSDLVHWTYLNDAFTSLPSWIAPGSELISPAIHYFNNQYYLYYEAPATTGTPGGSAIGVGTSATPQGPFTDSGTYVVEPQTCCGGGVNTNVNDPEVIDDGTGQLWIAYGGAIGGVHLRKLSANGLTSDPTSDSMIAIDNHYEGSFLWSHGGNFYLMLSSYGCCTGPLSGYSVWVGQSATITGPYLDQQGNSMDSFEPGGTLVLGTNGNSIVGPGGNSIFTDESGQDYILYHGVSLAQPYLPGVNGYTARQLMMDPLDWVNGWPVARGGFGPSDSTTPQPVPAAQPGAPNGYVPVIFKQDQPGTAIAASSDDFNEPSLSSQWNFIHLAPTYDMTGTNYEVQSVFADSCCNMADLPILAEPEPAGDYMMEVKVAFNLPAAGCCNFNFAQAGLFVYSDDGDYLRNDLAANFDIRNVEWDHGETPVASGYPTWASAGGGPPNPPGYTWFRIVKHSGAGFNGADTYTQYTSIDGVNYYQGNTWTATYGQNGLPAAQIGLFAGNIGGFTADFDYVHVTTLAASSNHTAPRHQIQKAAAK